jgi:cardiolipin synthase A/B
MTWIIGIIGIVGLSIHAAGVILAAHAILYARTSQGAIAWALSLISFPYVAAPLYLVFGRKKFQGYVAARRAGDRQIDHLYEALAATLAPLRKMADGNQQNHGVLETLAGFPFTGGNTTRLLVDGEATFEAIFAAIDAAQKYILVQFFIVRDDELGRKLQSRLIGRARAGVTVYFLYDEIGCIGLTKSYREELAQAGVQFKPFRTARGLKNRFQINFRNHRKIVVADGIAAYVGGHNVGNEYLGKSERFGHWRDTHVEIRGPAVGPIQLTFVRDWYWATGELPALNWACAGEASPGVPVLAVQTSPADGVDICTLLFLALISEARERLWITSPYFVPDETVYDALQLAAIRGVDVRIMLPAKPDHILVYLSAFSYLESAESVGVKFYRYNAGFLHQKVMLVDDKLAAIGTANLDNRSMRLNFEITVLCADPLFARDVESMLVRDFADCTAATRDDLQSRGVWFRLGVRLARLLSPVQ